MKKNITLKTALLFLFIIISAKLSDAQFYNGHQMTFGKNRVQYKKRVFKFYRYKDFDIYFYAGEEDMSKRIAEIAKQEIRNAEDFFDYGFRKRMIFVVYKKLADFRGSNIGFDSQNENSNIGGSTKIIDNKILVFFDKAQSQLRQEIRSGIYKMLINEMIYSGSFRQRLTNSALISLPDWYVNGLIMYLSQDWSSDKENIIRDGFESGKYKNINHLIGDDATMAGYSFWYFIGDVYGKLIIPNLIYITRISKNPESSFRSLLGVSTGELSNEWKEYYKKKLKIPDGKITIDKTNELAKSRKNRLWRDVKTAPNKPYISYIKHKKGRYKICIQTDKKTKVIRRHGHALEQITDYSQPVTAWHPSGKKLAFIVEEYGYLYFYEYNVETDKISKKRLPYFDKVLSFSYAKDGYSFVLSGVKNGQSDIYVYIIPANSHIQITNDLPDDITPIFTENSTKIVFASNRKDTLLNSSNEMAHCFDLFEYNYKKRSDKLIRITNTPYANECLPQDFSKDKLLLLSDKTGIKNRYIAQYDSSISSVDTAIHYRYFSMQKPVSNFQNNIIEHSFSKADNTANDLMLKDKRYRIFKHNLNLNETFNQPFESSFLKKAHDKYRTIDSIDFAKQKAKKLQQERIERLRKNPPKNLKHPDSTLIDIDNYVFEINKKSLYYDIYPIADSLFSNKKNSDKFIDTRNYKINFYTNRLVQQVDFGLLNNSYQIFTGSAYYFNPGINIFSKVGAYDLLEDYRISGGFRIGGNLDSYEYLLSFEDLKGRWDKQYVYHRQTQVQTYYDDYGQGHHFKIFSNEGIFALKYPFSQVSSARMTFSFRHDKGLWQANDYNTLKSPVQNQAFSGIKLEYIFDNTRSLGINLNDGIRLKIFSEFYQQVGKEMFGKQGMSAFSGYTNFMTLGGDFRLYKQIHRTLIFASRIGAGTSFGKSKLLYYLGGVDNWFSISPDKQMFDKNININREENYVYQAVATNMRGFIQNARNGNSFCVMNNEIRFPVIRYLANRPLNSDFLNTFQVVGFMDLGAAWSGKSPYDSKNKYLTEEVKSGPVTVVIEKNRSPVLLGYGFGLRSRIFGYFIRLDWAWGVDNYYVHDRVFYFSLNLDF